ncbi:MAG: hypothetical protein O2910_02145 [Proteobacteria bacterium]|nr:hypothetical protein [Pseudomonadota bacterium]
MTFLHRLALVAGSLLLVTSIGTANAGDAFTFNAETAGEPDVMAVPTQGGGMAAAVELKSNGKTTWASGETEEWTSTCRNLSHPVLTYDAVGICTSKNNESGDLLHLNVVCNAASEEQGDMNCFGYATGGTGKNENATGTITWHSKGGKTAGGGVR